MSAKYDKDSGRYEKLSEKNDEERNPVVRGGLGEDGEGDSDEHSDPSMIMESLEGKRGKELKDLARKWKVTPTKVNHGHFPRRKVPKLDTQLRREIYNKMLKHGGAPDAALAGTAGGSGKGARSPSSSREPSPALELGKGARKSRRSCASDVRPSPPKRKAAATNEGDQERETIQERMGKDKRIEEIEPDGNCLYGAIAHQLQQIRFRQEHDVKTLRKLAATYMLDHKDEMQAFLEDVLEEGQSVEHYCLEVHPFPAQNRALLQSLVRESLPAHANDDAERVRAWKAASRCVCTARRRVLLTTPSPGHGRRVGRRARDHRAGERAEVHHRGVPRCRAAVRVPGPGYS
jgi:hypothetical protein